MTAPFIYGTVIDKYHWETVHSHATHDCITYYFAIVVDETNTDNFYHIQVDVSTYDSVNIGDGIGIIYGGETL